MKNEYEFWSFNTDRFKVAAIACDDDSPDLSTCTEGELERINNGSLCVFGVVVRVTDRATGDVLGEDSLWGNIYETCESFIDHRGIRPGALKDALRFSILWLCKHGATQPRGRFFANLDSINRAYQHLVQLSRPNVVSGSYFSDMVRSAVEQARATIAKRASHYRCLSLELREGV